ncbi:DltB Predicted membrane protein involved in D-alanine export [Spirosomataceae bacterium]|jgi:alginate O-acetyltransferase complex protein AlgI
MLFNSLNFGFFLPIVFLLYWFVTHKNLKFQNLLLLISSYIFYASWDWRFLFLLIFSTLLDFCTGIKISEANNQLNKKIWLWLSISINLGFLAVFKYFNFFIDSFVDFFSFAGLSINPFSVKIILPVGISFYTFHGLSYIIDIYKKRIKTERNFIDYSVFVSFFPLLVAGPIERATHLLPQIQKKRVFNYFQASNGLRQILWGLFKKVVIADQCAEYANFTFNNPDAYSGSTLFLGAIFFAFQIYGDFSGYSDIAIGTAKLFGIKLLKNFDFPYFSRDIAEFWRRWHISLSSWFRDYLYIPLGGNNGNKWTKVKNTIIIFLVSGFWHGANWTFVIWGFLNALYILPSIIFNTNRTHLDTVAKNSNLPSRKDFFNITITFMLTTLAWILFRSENIKAALQYYSGILSWSFFSLPSLRPVHLLTFLAFFIFIEWTGRRESFALANLKLNKVKRWFLYLILTFCIYVFHGKEQVFIYFQF